MYANILTPLDGSPFGESAVPVAVAIANRTGAVLRLVHVADPRAAATAPRHAIPAEPLLADEARNASAERLKRMVESVRSEGRVEVQSDLVEGAIEASLLAYGEQHRPALFVLTTHGRGGVRRAMLGSVADALVRRSSLPVLAVRPDGARRLSDHQTVDRIMLPLDGSHRDEEIFEHARVIARAMTAEFLLVQVLQPKHDMSRPAVKQIDRVNMREQRAEAEKYLNRIVQHIGTLGSPASAHLLQEDDVAQELLAFASAQKVDIIAMATRGRGRLQRIVEGSVADRVLCESSVPGVLLYRVE